MTTPLTMTAEQEADIRLGAAFLTMDEVDALLAELDATRARLAEAEAALRALVSFAEVGLPDVRESRVDAARAAIATARALLAPERPA